MTTNAKTLHKLNVPNAKTLHEMSSDELRNILANARNEMLSIRGNIAKGNPGFGGKHVQTRKTIARCITILVKRGEPCVVKEE